MNFEDQQLLKIKLKQLLYDKRLSMKAGVDVESDGYAPNAQIRDLRLRIGGGK